MITQTFDRDSRAVPAKTGDVLRVIGARISQAIDALGPSGRRFTLTGLGALCALGLGALAASVIQLPPDMKDAAQAQDQGVVQTELPSEVSARAYALENPPGYTTDGPKEADDPALPDASPNLAALHDDEPTTVTYTGPTDDQPTRDADHRSAATPAPVSASPATADMDAAAG